MAQDQFEEVFGDFLERAEYDAASDALFTVVRAAFLAGWKAAGGEEPKPRQTITMLYSPEKEE